MSPTRTRASRARRIRARTAAVALVLLLSGAASAVAVGGPPPKGKPAPSASKPPADDLPAGCIRLRDTHRPIFDATGKRMVFERSRVDPVKKDEHGFPVRTHAAWVRDMATGKETHVADDTIGEGFAPDGTVLLRLGYGVNPATGARVAGVATLPAPVPVETITWSRDGQRVAYVPTVPLHERTSVHVVIGKAAPAPLSGTAGLRVDQTTILAWSPDGARLLVNGLFDLPGQFPTRCVGIVDAATGEMKVVARMPDWINLPGYHDGRARYMNPRLETLDSERGPIWYRPSTRPRHGRNLWDAEGRLFTWVEGTGWIEADAFVGDPATGQTWRITNDGEAKWSPALDPAGRRVAFLTADEAWVGGAFKSQRVRVVDLRTGEPTDYPVPEKSGVAASLVWSPDGKQVCYELLDGEEYYRCYLQAIPPAKPVAKDAPIKALELRPQERIIAWLSSYDPEHVHCAVHRAEDAWDKAYVPALRAALKTWTSRNSQVTSCSLQLLGRESASEAVPEIRLALGSASESVRRLAGRLLALFAATDAVDDLRAAAKAASSSWTKISLAGSLIRLGDGASWSVLEAALKQTSAATRRDACAALWRIREPRAVELLIPLVADASSLGNWSTKERKTVGDAAQCALEALTGESYGADVAAWTSWWSEAGRKVPAPGKTPPDLLVLLND